MVAYSKQYPKSCIHRVDPGVVPGDGKQLSVICFATQKNVAETIFTSVGRLVLAAVQGDPMR
jgi:hypothetical protein